MNGLQQWHEVMRSGDMESLFQLIHPDCIFLSPVVHTPQVGRDITFAYLSAATGVLSEGFEYTREVVDGDHAVLEFTTTVNGVYVNGIDMITFRDDKIIEFKVMVRPLKAVNEVHRQMGAMLEKLKAATATH